MNSNAGARKSLHFEICTTRGPVVSGRCWDGFGPENSPAPFSGGGEQSQSHFFWSMRNGTLAIQSLLRTSAETLGVHFLFIKKAPRTLGVRFLIIKKRETPKTLCFLCRTFHNRGTPVGPYRGLSGGAFSCERGTPEPALEQYTGPDRDGVP